MPFQPWVNRKLNYVSNCKFKRKLLANHGKGTNQLICTSFLLVLSTNYLSTHSQQLSMDYPSSSSPQCGHYLILWTTKNPDMYDSQVRYHSTPKARSYTPVIPCLKIFTPINWQKGRDTDLSVRVKIWNRSSRPPRDFWRDLWGWGTNCM